MDTPLSRRRVLAAGGVGAALSLAGCNSLGSDGLSDSDSSTASVTVFADLDQEELEAYQADLREQVESGEMDQEEAQQKARQKQVELMTESVESFEERADENDDLEVSETVTESGVLLVDGTGAALVDTLGYEEVHGLLAESEFDQYQQAEQAEQSGQSGQSEQSGESGESSDSGESEATGEANESEESGTEGAETPEGTADSA